MYPTTSNNRTNLWHSTHIWTIHPQCVACSGHIELLGDRVVASTLMNPTLLITPIRNSTGWRITLSLSQSRLRRNSSEHKLNGWRCHGSVDGGQLQGTREMSNGCYGRDPMSPGPKASRSGDRSYIDGGGYTASAVYAFASLLHLCSKQRLTTEAWK